MLKEINNVMTCKGVVLGWKEGGVWIALPIEKVTKVRGVRRAWKKWTSGSDVVILKEADLTEIFEN